MTFAYLIKIIVKKVLTQFQSRNNIHHQQRKRRYKMLDNVTIVALGGAVVGAIFAVAGAIAEWKGWK